MNQRVCLNTPSEKCEIIRKIFVLRLWPISVFSQNDLSKSSNLLDFMDENVSMRCIPNLLNHEIWSYFGSIHTINLEFPPGLTYCKVCGHHSLVDVAQL